MTRRRRAIGAEVTPDGVHFRVWAPSRRKVVVVFEDGDRAPLPLTAETGGYFSAIASDARAGTRYRFALDDDEKLYPDPASRFQPEGPHGPSVIINPRTYQWRDERWSGAKPDGHVIYEMHIGTFTPRGTWQSAEERLGALRDLGITMIEMMPVADFPGRFGWGYDGVALWAPAHQYGTPDDLRHFIDTAHDHGLAVILDVVYNHFGPDGNYLKQFATDYFTDRYSNEWGEAINFDGPDSAPVREFFTHNAAYWIDEFHFDGLRLDATQSIHDSGEPHILAEIAAASRESGGKRAIYLVAENEPQDVRNIRPRSENGFGLDAIWNDDFHHTARVALTGRTHAYYTDYRGTPQELISAAKWGFLFQGQWYSWQKKRRGTATLGIPACAFVTFLENHDQVANSARGQRLAEIAAPSTLRALSALLLLAPGTPMLFQGQEFGSTAAWLFFADHGGELGEKVEKGRREFLAQFPTLGTPAMEKAIRSPGDAATFEACKLDWTQAGRNIHILAFHRDLIALRKSDPIIAAQRSDLLHGAVLSAQCFVLRWLTSSLDDRLFVINLGADLELSTVPEPLLAPPAGTQWRTRWSSEEPKYGGCGWLELDEARWRVTAASATLLAPHPLQRERSEKKK